MINRDVPRHNIPSTPGVYMFKTPWAQILYIGKAKQLRKRLQHYFTPSSVRKQDMVAKAKYIEWFPVNTEQEALMLELQLLNTHQPPFNNLIRGESSYFYLRLSREPFPRLELTRYKKNDHADYFGPKLRKRDLKQLLQLLRHLFQRRGCGPTQFTKGVVCSDYFFGLCAGWCTFQHQTPLSIESNRRLGVKIVESAAEAEIRYEQFRSLLKAFFTGNTTPIEDYIVSEIARAVTLQHYERAAKLRDIYQMVTSLSEQQRIILDQPKVGIFALLEQRGAFWYIVVIRLYNGKIVDVITKKELTIDCDIAELTATLTQTFGYALTHEIAGERHILFWATGKPFAQRHLKLLTNHAHQFWEARVAADMDDPRDTPMHLLEDLQQRYALPTLPKHIETIDISHSSGKNTVGGLVSFVQGSKYTAGYRRYRIRRETRGDDYAALEEMLKVRFGLQEIGKKTTDPAPDLLIIDGGKGQLGICYHLAQTYPQFASLLSTMSVVSIGKGKARQRKGKREGEQEAVYTLANDWTITSVPMENTSVDQFLRRMRDEAHRFANAYRKTLKRKEFSGKKATPIDLKK